jgi:pimeloyl-ACP methyl ester carboxylesterase
MNALPPLGSGPPLVYLPGLDGTAEMLFPHEASLAHEYRVLRVPSRERRPFGYADLVDDVLCALDAEGAGRAIVVGESFGSTVALRLALEHPDRVERLVIVSGFARFPDRSLLRLGNMVGNVVPPSLLLGVRRTLVVPLLAVDGVAAEHRSRFVRIALGRPFDGYLGRVNLISGFDVRDRLGEISAPTLVLAGVGDKLVPVGCAVELARRLPNATLCVLPCAGHACLLAPRISLSKLLAEWQGPRAREESRVSVSSQLATPHARVNRSTPVRGV